MSRNTLIGGVVVLLVLAAEISPALGQVNYRAAKNLARKAAGKETVQQGARPIEPPARNKAIPKDANAMERALPPEVIVTPVGKGVLGITPDPRAVASGLYIMPRPAVKKATVKFTVTEPSGVARKNYPVRGSIPMFRGELPSAKTIRLIDDRGRQIPVQGLTTSVWPEGTVKFLCLDFLIDIGPKQTRTYTLEYGSAVKPSQHSVEVHEFHDGLGVKTGPVKALFMTGDRGLCKVMRGRSEVTSGPITGRMLVSKGDPKAEPVELPLIIKTVKIVENGPVQATVYLGGSYGEELSATTHEWEAAQKTPRYPVHIFVRMYAGSGRMDVIHSVGYNGDENVDFIRRYGLRVPLNTGAGKKKFVFGGDKGIARTIGLNGRITLTQPGHSSWTLDAGRAGMKGKRFGGWAGIKSQNASVVIGLRSAWQQWPVSFSANEDGELTVDIYGGDDDTFLDLRYRGEGYDPAAKKGLHMSKSMYAGNFPSTRYGGAPRKFAMGLMKTSELVIDFTPGADAAAIGNAQHQMLIPWAGAKRFSDTRVLGLTGYYHKGDKRHKRARTYFDILLDFPLAAHEANKLYGWVDYPDAPDFKRPKQGSDVFDDSEFEGGIGWSNGERLTMGYFGHWIAGGQRRALDIGHMMSLHNMGFDIEHPGGDATRGCTHRHSQVHWGTDGGPRQAGWRGWYMHYWLTGHNEIWRSIRELHPMPMGVHRNPNAMWWPYHRTWNPDRWAMQPSWEWTLVDSGGGTPFHMMNNYRWQTAGDTDYVRFLDQVMDTWARNPKQTSKNAGTGKTSTRGLDYIKVNISDGSVEYPSDIEFVTPNPADPVRPWLHRYRFDTYGGVELVSDWAQLTGSSHAVDTILLIGDYQAENQRIDQANSDKQGKYRRNMWQLYRGLDGFGPAYALLRAKDYPHRVARVKKALEWRLHNYTYGSPRKLAKGAKPAADPQSYTAQGYAKTGVVVYGQNGPKIHGAQAMINLYNLWFSRPEADKK